MPIGLLSSSNFVNFFWKRENFMNSKSIYIIILMFFLSAWTADLSLASVGGEPQGLRVQVHHAQHEGKIWAAVQLDLADQYYAYAPQNAEGQPVNAGQALQFFVPNVQGQALPVYFPLSVAREDYYEKDKIIAAYTGDIFLFVPLGDAMQARGQQGELSLLLCSQKHCLPVSMSVNLRVPEGKEIPLLMQQSYAALWHEAVQRGAVSQDFSEQEIVQNDTQLSPKKSSLSGGLARLKQGRQQDISAASAIVITSATSVTLGQNTNTSLEHFTPVPYAQSLEVSSLGKAIFLGLLAGLILNIMPCVLPVLTLKIQALLLSTEGAARIAAFREHNIYFAAGIWAQFLILGTLLGSLGFIWGELFQNIIFVASMLVLIFVLALSLMGLFTLPMLDIKNSSHGSPRRQAFFAGALATLLATPCSGPLLGGVLSWAFLQPLHLTVLTIFFVGVGMSLPYMLFAWQPQWVRFMPKPGAWMLYMEKIIAFFLLATTVYIFSLLPSYMHIPMLAGLVFLAFLGWIWGSFGALQAPAWRRRLLGGLFMLSAIMVILGGSVTPKQEENASAIGQWQAFSPALLQEKLGKVPLMVEFTADWCPNCKYVEKTVLTEDNLRAWQQKYDLQYIKVDITRNHPAGEALLQALGSKSIPLTALFPVGEGANSPVVLRDIYTEQSLEGALRQAFSN